MPSMLGKRKARPAEDKEEDDSAAAAARDLLRKHFEARFKPVAAPGPAVHASKSQRNEDDDSEDDDDYDDDEDDETISDESSDGEWGGLSGEEQDSDTPRVEVVDHTVAEPVNTSTMTKKELKAYLSSRPPDHAADAVQTTTAKPKTSATEEDSATFLANDLALQRLISESHILAAAGGNSSHYLSSAAEESAAANNKTFVEGRIRRKTTDLRIQALGAKQSALAQAKMPMGMRKGINSAAVTKEDKRRREAKENGIILEREAKKVKGGGVKKRSLRPVDLPGVGKLRGAELRITERDVRSIEGFKKTGGREKKSRGRRK